MKTYRQTLLIAALALLPLASVAQSPPQGGGSPFITTGSGAGGGQSSSKPWADFKLDPKKTVQLNFRNANVDLVLDFFMKATGVTIVKDPTLKDAMTVSSPKSVSLSQAFEILQAALSVRNYNLEKSGNLLIIKKQQDRGNNGGFDPSMFQSMMGNNNSTELKYYKIQYAAASQVADTINQVFADTGQNNNPFAAFQFGGRNQRGGRGGRPSFSFGGGGQQQATVRASADDYSNTLIVNAPRDKQRDIEDLIAEIDKRTDQPVKSVVYPLQFADATELANTIQTVINGQPQTGRGATPSQGNNNRGGGRGGFFAALFGGNDNTNVAPDTRSNSLIVTTTEENQQVIAQLVTELDKEVPIENNTFVIPLKNARSDNVADLLNQAFGNNRSGGNNRNTNSNRTNNNNRSNNNNRGGNNNNRGGLSGDISNSDLQASVSADGKYLQIPMDDQAIDDNQLYTQVRFGQTFGQNRNNNNNSQNNMARGQDGRLTNIRDLSGNTTVISDPNTNSIIVVTDPNNLELIQQILGQLDQIPEQVMIETVIVEATLDKSLKLGVEWNYAAGKSFGQTGVKSNGVTDFGGQTGTTPAQGFRYTVSGGNIGAFLNALATDDKYQVLSTPRIFTSNNVEAQINISQSIPYVLSTREDTNGNLSYNYAFQDVGIILDVTPQITANGYVTLDVSQTANDLQGYTDFNAPIVNQRQAQTTVSVKDGDTIILGGIIRNTVTSTVKKVPLLGDIPILGELFKSTSKDNQKTELMVFLTPHIVRNDEDARKLKEDQIKQLSDQSQKKLGDIKQPDKSQSGGIKSGPKQPGKQL